LHFKRDLVSVQHSIAVVARWLGYLQGLQNETRNCGFKEIPSLQQNILFSLLLTKLFKIPHSYAYFKALQLHAYHQA